MLICTISRSKRAVSKFQVTIRDPRTHSERVVHFGAKGYSDYTLHRDPARMERYTMRHQRRENWTRSGVYTAGFWAKWILWNKPTLSASIRDTARRFRLKIVDHTKE